MAETTPLLLALAVLAGFVGGAMNALAGGGTFATLPALIAYGVPSTLANATSIVALQPGAMMGRGRIATACIRSAAFRSGG